MKTILLLIVILTGCCGEKPQNVVKDVEKPKDSTISRTPYQGCNYYSVSTIKHDNHLFIIWDGSQKGGLLHHPDCPCSKK